MKKQIILALGLTLVGISLSTTPSMAQDKSFHYIPPHRTSIQQKKWLKTLLRKSDRSQIYYA